MQTPENPNEKRAPEAEKAGEKKQDFNELFRTFIGEYNRNNQKNYDAGKVSAWLDLANRYTEIKPGQEPAKPAESMDVKNMGDILEKTKKDDEASIASWIAFADKYQKEHPEKQS